VIEVKEARMTALIERERKLRWYENLLRSDE